MASQTPPADGVRSALKAVIEPVLGRDVVSLGLTKKIDVEGGAVPTLSGRITQISRVVRSRSKAKPVPVIDVNIEFDTPAEAARLKPGQPVRVELQAGEGA